MSWYDTSILLVTFIIWMFTSASLGRMSTTECDNLCSATVQFGFSFSRSKIESTRT